MPPENDRDNQFLAEQGFLCVLVRVDVSATGSGRFYGLCLRVEVDDKGAKLKLKLIEAEIN